MRQWWDKPVDIDLPTEIYLNNEQFKALKNASDDAAGEPNPTNPFSEGRLGKDSKGAPDNQYVTSRAGLGILMYRQLSDGKNVFTSIATLGDAFDRIIKGKANIIWETVFLSTVGLLYGGLHLASWDNHFESRFEEQAWKACAVNTAVALLGFVLELCIGNLMSSYNPEKPAVNPARPETNQRADIA